MIFVITFLVVVPESGELGLEAVALHGALLRVPTKFRDPVVVGGPLLVEVALDHRDGLVSYRNMARFPRVLLRHALGHERHLGLLGRARRRLFACGARPPPAPPGLFLPGAPLGLPVFALCAAARRRRDAALVFGPVGQLLEALGPLFCRLLSQRAALL